ncbi:MAG: histidinol-phosphate transaminase [Gammaproteobacteria bacterium]
MSRRDPAPLGFVSGVEPYLPGDFAAEGVEHPVKLSSNESPFGPSARAIEAYLGTQSTLARYPDSQCSELRETHAAIHSIESARIVCEAGSEQLINLLARSYAGPGDEIVHSRNGFIAFRIAAQSCGATAVAAEERDYVASVEAILDCVTGRTRIVFLANPNNPTGTWISASEVRRLRHALPAHVLLVLDGAYAEYMDDGEYTSGMELVNDTEPNTVVLRTFSKIHGLAALRVGWAYCPTPVADVLGRMRGVFTVSTPAQRAATASVADEAHVARARRHNLKWRAWLFAELRQLGLQPLPSGGNFLCIAFRNRSEAQRADTALRKAGLIPRRLEEYGLEHCLRLTIGLECHNRGVVEALSALR